MIGVAVLGYGYWGPKLARNFAALPDARIVAIADVDETARALAAREYPEALIAADAAAAIAAPGVDAVAIATPPAWHYAQALAAIEADKHVLIEKPCGTSFDQARAITAAAAASGRTLMVDHTFIYSPAVEVLASIARGGELGELIYIESVRTNLARFDPAIGVVRDLATHDLAILDHVTGRAPVVVSARNRRLPGEPEDFAFLALDYGGVPAHLHVDCVSPVKIRRMTIGGTEGVVIFDDMEPVEKIRWYRRGRASTAELRTGFRSGAVICPPIAAVEPLARMAAHFVHCAATKARPLTDGASALRVLAAVDAVERCLHPATTR